MKLVAFFLISVGLLGAETFPVEQLKTAWFDGTGTVEITENGISFQAKDAERSRDWSWLDIQYFDRVSETEFVVLTYEDRKRYLGRDRSYRFRITDGELSDELFRMISEKLGRPVTNRVVREPSNVLYEIPAKHLHTFGGCEGLLRFWDDRIQYVTEHEKDNREWLLDRDVNSIWSADTYRLDVHAYDNNRRAFSRTRVYQFDLKTPLDAASYRDLKLKLYNLETTHLPLVSQTASGAE